MTMTFDWTMISAWTTERDLMVGIDKHNELCIPPLPPLTSNMHTHLVAATMRWAANSGQFGPPTVFVENRAPCKFFHDISFFIPHIPVPLPGWVLLPAIITFSSAKVALGSFSVYATGEPAGLCGHTSNCWSNFPRPSGMIIPTRLPTVFVGVSFVDFLLSALWAGVDTLISFSINKIFDKYGKEPLAERLTKLIGNAVGKYAEVELIAAISQIVVKVTGDVVKKVAGKFGKAGINFLGETVKEWFARTNPGMQEKYIIIFEAEAPRKFAVHLHEIWLPQIEKSTYEALQRDLPDLHALVLEEPPAAVSLQEIEGIIQETNAPMIKDAVRGLLSGNQWEKLLAAHNRTGEGRERRT